MAKLSQKTIEFYLDTGERKADSDSVIHPSEQTKWRINPPYGLAAP